MAKEKKTRIPEILQKHESELLQEWVKVQLSSTPARRGLIKEQEIRNQSQKFLKWVLEACQTGNITEIHQAPEWAQVRELLGQISKMRAIQGFSPAETASFVFSIKQPLMEILKKECKEMDELVDEFGSATTLFDKLGLYTTELYQRTREEIITRQQSEMLELSTPVVSLWEGILALPMIGTLDSSRTQVVMETLLQKIVETGSEIAIIDITGVPTVDTLVAQHLLKTVAAARLMGADCIISGIRPQIAQTMVHLAVDLSNVITKATLSAAFRVALQKLNLMEAGEAGRAGNPQASPPRLAALQSKRMPPLVGNA